jgi:hypothetical protein
MYFGRIRNVPLCFNVNFVKEHYPGLILAENLNISKVTDQGLIRALRRVAYPGALQSLIRYVTAHTEATWIILTDSWACIHGDAVTAEYMNYCDLVRIMHSTL